MEVAKVAEVAVPVLTEEQKDQKKRDMEEAKHVLKSRYTVLTGNLIETISKGFTKIGRQLTIFGPSEIPKKSEESKTSTKSKKKSSKLISSPAINNRFMSTLSSEEINTTINPSDKLKDDPLAIIIETED